MIEMTGAWDTAIVFGLAWLGGFLIATAYWMHRLGDVAMRVSRLQMESTVLSEALDAAVVTLSDEDAIDDFQEAVDERFKEKFGPIPDGDPRLFREDPIALEVLLDDE